MGETTLTLPTVPDGFEISIYSSSNVNVITTDGTISPPPVEENVDIILYIQKTADGTVTTAGAFTVVVPAATDAAQGTPETPLEIGDASSSPLVHSGVVGDQYEIERNSYYKVTVDQSYYYEVSLTGLERDADLYIESESDTLGSSTEDGTTDEIVSTIEHREGYLYIEVHSRDDEGTYFDLTVTPGAEIPGDEGSETTPLNIGDAGGGSITHNGSVSRSGDSYYVITVTDSSATYTVTAETTIGPGAGVYVLDTGPTSGVLDSGSTTADTPLELTGLSPTGTEMYVWVQGWSAGAASYTLTVTEE